MHKNDTSLISVWDIPLSLVLLTRLPVPRLPENSFIRQAEATWAFPLVGLAVGLLANAAAWFALALNLPAPVSAIFLIAVLVLTTGAMHEDGLADTADGLWGGFTAERRLEIMKDSHIGTYGVLALIFSQTLRIMLVTTLLASGGFSTILAACITSRAVLPFLMAALPNARTSGLSHSVGAPRAGTVALGLGLAVLCVALLMGAAAALPMLVVGLAIGFFAQVARSKIGGQTGDILGASQQLAELAFLTVAVAAL
ncbi:adenosylcobinamide-GDP ribazoletransferase [Ruegeria profundi]|uniref:Adenosylcobinamide-GDP ribazoletransferase n=1 Tax=Ruegeria profundi TaxID=1685378 RepID=A0A0X3TWA1_9RHOB|nr:adenosylcobinamide-GDP ribazoletransferase [Ruegeria profundi]KUJ79973.1 cobalamin synthase [Ruegeria profundi]